MNRGSSVEAGFTLTELVVVLAILGIVGGAVASLIGWSVRVQARQEAAQLAQESAQGALDRIGRLLRTAGAGGRPALWNGEPDSLVLCGLPWVGRDVRASVRLDQQGFLVLAPVSSTGGVVGCAGHDLPAPMNLVPGATFSEVRFRYITAAGDTDRCSNTSPPSCTAVTGVLVRVTPRGAASGAQQFVALRNPGGP